MNLGTRNLILYLLCATALTIVIVQEQTNGDSVIEQRREKACLWTAELIEEVRTLKECMQEERCGSE